MICSMAETNEKRQWNVEQAPNDTQGVGPRQVVYVGGFHAL